MRDSDFLGAGDPGALEALFGHPRSLDALAEAYRRWGWLAADVDPLVPRRPEPGAAFPMLDPRRYGSGDDDAEPWRKAYCGTIGWEFGHIADPTRRDWLAERAEAQWRPGQGARTDALDLIARAEYLERTLDRRLPGAKTFGLSGAEGYLVLLAGVLDRARAGGARQAVIGGMHRGRLTQAGLVFGKPLARLVADAMGTPEFPEELGASSDSPYHLGWEGEIETSSGPMDIWLAPHPSHLSVVGPVALGQARARQAAGEAVLPLVLHTDAALAGQGINAEMLQIGGLAPFDVGGAIHLVLDNQIGFTTGPEEARTAAACTDVARMVDAPVLHVNGDDPDALLRAGEVAVNWREAFGSDLFVRVVTYRRKGHNEIDQPRFTQPDLYRDIDALPPLSKRYAAQVGSSPDLSGFSAEVDDAFARARDWRPNTVPEAPGLVASIEERMLAPVATGMSEERLRLLGERLCKVPDGIEPHPKVAEFLAARRGALASGTIDWATAEALALASLIAIGEPLRLGGQDSVRGAFTQRHLAIHCQRTGGVHRPLGHRVFNTPLTENAVLAFEYGHSIGARGLTVWEAQFGDFLNTAQAIWDQFIICGEDRWLFPSNLVLLLPHGVDGGGPDHATAHPERLLASCARGNVQVANLTTPANYFHVLRRQVLADWKKPLAVLAPKALLRHAGARSALADLGGAFRPVIGDGRKGARRVVLSTGKLSVMLDEARTRREIEDVALVRLEQLYPLDGTALARALAPHGDAELVWAQEEPENFGYFQWLDRRLERLAGRPFRLVSRAPSPSASAGPKSWDDDRLAEVIDRALG